MHILATLLLMSGIAEAAPTFDIREAADGTQGARHAVAPTSSAVHALSRTIYLNRNGGIIRPGYNDSRADTSSIISSPVDLPGWTTDATTWAETVACLREIWAPFDVEITEIDPGQTPHIEARFGGLPATLGLPANVGGVAPMAYDCSIVDNAIVFAFPSKLNNKARRVCEVISQEIGHSYGLDHELEPADPMTYLSYAGERTFQDHDVACGETTARPCGIGGRVCRATQNSFQILLERLGQTGSDHTAPTIELFAPLDNTTVEPGFVVVANASDDVGVTAVSLHIDGLLVASGAAGAEFATDPELASGAHTLMIEAVDAEGNASTVEVAIQIADAPDGMDDEQGFMPSMGCATGGAGDLAGLLLVALFVLRRSKWRQPA